MSKRHPVHLLCLLLILGSVHDASGQEGPQEFRLLKGGVKITTPTWGPHCGQRPPNRRDKPGTRYLLRRGRLIAKEGGPKIDQAGVCRSATRLPAIKETVTANGFSCRSPKGVGTRAKGTARRKFSGADKVSIEHSFSYEWRLHGSHCQVKSTGRWTLARHVPKAAEPKVVRCEAPGPVAQLRAFSPTRMRVAPTSKTRFRIQALDRHKCAVKTPIGWQSTVGKIDQAGRLVLDGVPAGKRIVVTATVGRFKKEFKVITEDRNALADLAPIRERYNPEVALQAEDQVHSIRVNVKATVQSDPTPWSTSTVLSLSLFSLLGGLIFLAIAVRLRAPSSREENDELA